MHEDEIEGDAWTIPKPKASRRSRSRLTTTSCDTKSKESTPEVAASKDSSIPPMPAARPLGLLVCSIGNPGSAYANTLHSAGHTVVTRLAERLGYANFQKDRALGNGLVSKNPYTPAEGMDWTLWQSTSYMNESGKGVRAAWNAWSKNIPEGEARLVVVHDDLDKPLGAVSVKTTQGASAKGHNGLKSLMAVMGKVPFARIGVGIGRPESRHSNDISKYVLRKMTSQERGTIEESVEQVIAKLQVLAKG